MAQSTGTRNEATEAADALEEAWEAMRDAWREAARALRRMDSPAERRLDAYVAQVFDPETRMLGMQSVDAWIGEAVAALRDDGSDDGEDGFVDCGRCGERDCVGC